MRARFRAPAAAALLTSQRAPLPQVKRCDEMLRKLRFFSDQIAKADLVAVARPPRDTAYELDELEVKLEELERELLEVNANVEKLRRSHRCVPRRCAACGAADPLPCSRASQRARGAAAGAGEGWQLL